MLCRALQVARGLMNLIGVGPEFDKCYKWEKLKGYLRCEAPNDKVNDFVGQMCM